MFARATVAVMMLDQPPFSLSDSGAYSIMWFDVAITLSCAGCGLVCG